MKYPNYDTYNKLYGRYLTKSIDPFFEGIDLKGKRVLDLCAGNGRLAQYAINHAAKLVVMVDASPQMLNPEFSGDNRAIQIEGSIEDYLNGFRRGEPYDIISPLRQGLNASYRGGMPDEDQFDIVTCRQGTNYWFMNVSGEAIANVLLPNGMLIFNTFGNQPSEKPTVREYYHAGRAYSEISYLIGNMVHHIQTASGIPPHVTSFRWISREEYKHKLSPHFKVEEVIDGPSSMWYCKKI